METIGKPPEQPQGCITFNLKFLFLLTAIVAGATWVWMKLDPGTKAVVVLYSIVLSVALSIGSFVMFGLRR